MKITFQVDCLDGYMRRLAELARKSDKVALEALYKGAGIVADAVREEIEAIPEHKPGVRGGIREYEREALLSGLGISPANVFDDDFLNAKIGFDGYSDRKRSGRRKYKVIGEDSDGKVVRYVAKVYSGDVPIPVIARSVVSGAPFSQKYPFVRTAVRRVREEAYEAMKNVFESEIKRIMSKQ